MWQNPRSSWAVQACHDTVHAVSLEALRLRRPFGNDDLFGVLLSVLTFDTIKNLVSNLNSVSILRP